MSIEESVLYADVLEIAEDDEIITKAVWECLIICGDSEEVHPETVDAITVDRDYMESYCDNIVMEVTITGGLYTHVLYPNRFNISVVLTKYPRTAKGNILLNIEYYKPVTYKAVLINAQSPYINDQGDYSDDIKLGDKSSLLSVPMQLIDPVVDSLRCQSVQTIFKHVSIEDVLKITMMGNNASLPMESQASGVVVMKPTNSKVYDHLVMAGGIELLDLPDHLQTLYGIYSTGLGYYIQRSIVYIYALNQLNQYNVNPDKMTIVSIPSDKFYGTEKTFKYHNGELCILATGDVLDSDTSDALYRNVGNGVIYQDASRVIDGYGFKSEGKYTVYNNNVIRYVNHERRDGDFYTPYSKYSPTINHCKVASELSTIDSRIVSVSWQNADPSLLIPGMAVRYLHRRGTDIHSVYGILISVRYISSASNPGILNDVHTTNAVLALALNKIAE